MTRKRATITAAYTLLAAISIWTVALDTYGRMDSEGSPEISPASEPIATTPLPLAPLANSPFPRKSSPGVLTASVAVASPVLESPREGTRRMAPFGVFFLRVPVQAQTDEGAKSFNAGTQVRVIRRQNGRIKVTHDGADFFVEDWQISNEPDSVAVLARATS